MNKGYYRLIKGHDCWTRSGNILNTQSHGTGSIELGGSGKNLGAPTKKHHFQTRLKTTHSKILSTGTTRKKTHYSSRKASILLNVGNHHYFAKNTQRALYKE